MTVIDLTHCPEPTCQLPAEVTDRFVLPSVAGPIEYLTGYCLGQHIFSIPTGRPADDGVRGVGR